MSNKQQLLDKDIVDRLHKEHELYILIRWPHSQKIVDYNWFTECYPAFNEDYFVPVHRYIQFLKD